MYIVESSPQGNRRRSRYAFECGASGVLGASLVSVPSDHSLSIPVSYRSVCRECATCCGACRNFQYPWLDEYVR